VLQPIQVSQSPESKFREYLSSRRRPQRYTAPQRDMVRFIFSSHNHFDAEQLCSEMDRSGLNVSRATVYRTLTKLVDAGLLRRLELGPRVVYEHDYGYPEHEHLYCQQCGRVIEFESPRLESVYAEICRQQGFQPRSHSLIVRGICADCNRARITKRRLDLV
jgi:Fur family ferric uptake transcriptional regulator